LDRELDRLVFPPFTTAYHRSSASHIAWVTNSSTCATLKRAFATPPLRLGTSTAQSWTHRTQHRHLIYETDSNHNIQNSKMECDSTPTLFTRTQTSVPAAPVLCPKPEGPFVTTASIDDLEVSGSWPRSTEVVPATLPIMNKASFTKVKTWVIRAPEDNISKEKSTISNNKSNSSNRGNFELELGATPLRNGLRQMVDDTRQKLMAMRK
ncbi:hypothetical protein Vretimale_19798, partial [Volvox reticuliferus]